MFARGSALPSGDPYPRVSGYQSEAQRERQDQDCHKCVGPESCKEDGGAADPSHRLSQPDSLGRNSIHGCISSDGRVVGSLLTSLTGIHRR
jgi:hypothetical protein